MNRGVACGQDIGYRGRAALRVGRKVGDNMWEWGRIVCVCVCLSSSCVLCTQCYQSIQSPEVSTSLLGKTKIII
jgi:hypothetical protein